MKENTKSINDNSKKDPFRIKDIKNVEIAEKILTEIMNFRRVPRPNEACAGLKCQKCSSLYLANISLAVKKNQPVIFVLPAFPGKSPNPEKVLGHLPDYAEWLSLNFLQGLCLRVREYYSPGIKIIICSDGRVFSDVIGIKEDHITTYQIELEKIINELSSGDISTFNLDDFYKDQHFIQMRNQLMDQYGQSLNHLKRNVRNGKTSLAKPDEQAANHMYCGITRFLFEDSLYPRQTKSRSAIQKESRVNAYEVIRRSNAWSELIAEYFPNATRLSIHPQSCGSSKLGIRLIANESWMTPWHGVAVKTFNGYILLKKSDAIAMGAELIYDSNGRPSHYKLRAGNENELKL